MQTWEHCLCFREFHTIVMKDFAICGALTAIMHMSAYATSAEMAKEIGTFPGYKQNKKHMLRVIRNHKRAAYNVPSEEYENLKIYPVGINPKHCPSDLLKLAREDADRALELGEQYGFQECSSNCHCSNRYNRTGNGL